MNFLKLIYKKTRSPYFKIKNIIGIFKIKKALKHKYKKITLFNIPLLCKYTYKYVKKILLFDNILVYKKDYQIITLNKIANKISSEFDDVYIYKHHIGEIYIYLNLVKEYIKYNQSKNPLLIVNEKRYIPLYKMFLTDVNIKYIPLSSYELDAAFQTETVKYKSQKYFSPTPDRFKEFRNLIFNSKSNNVHFYNYIKKSMHIQNNDITFEEGNISDETIKSVINKTNNIGLNLDKFIIIFPEAVTASLLPLDFWREIVERFKKEGYDVFLNVVSDQYNSLNLKTCVLNLDEIYYLTKISKGIIALVNGLVVSFAQINVPRFIIYTEQTKTIGKRMTATTMLNAYAMGLLPNAYTKNLFEIDINEISINDILHKISQYYNLSNDYKDIFVSNEIKENKRCPFCGSKQFYPIKEFLMDENINEYKKTYKIDPIGGAYRGKFLIKNKCVKCGIDFYNYHIEDSAQLYEELIKSNLYFYPKYKWEYEEAIQFVLKYGYKKILDIACGSGYFLEKLKNITDIAGTEYNPIAIKNCEEKNIQIYNSDLTKIKEKFDFISMFQLLEHLKNPKEFIEQALSLLNNGGHLCIATPNSDGFWCKTAPGVFNLPPHHNLDITKDFYFNLPKFFNVKIIEYKQDKPEWELYKYFYYPYITKHSINNENEHIVYLNYLEERNTLIGHNHLCLLEKLGD